MSELNDFFLYLFFKNYFLPQTYIVLILARKILTLSLKRVHKHITIHQSAYDRNMKKRKNVKVASLMMSPCIERRVNSDGWSVGGKKRPLKDTLKR